MKKLTIVLDTNTIVSALCFPQSIVRQAFNRAINEHQIVASSATWAELTEVINRQKFDKYVPSKERLLFLETVKQKVIFTEPTETITDCRDPKDNKFLELAVAANAEFIVTGDLDLLILNPFRNISILKSSEFLTRQLDNE
jgi:uncharacterized protein